MEQQLPSLNYQLPNVALRFNAYAQKILENSQRLVAVTESLTPPAVSPIIATPTTTTAAPLAIATSLASVATTPLDVHKLQVTTSELLQKLSASLFNSIQLQGIAARVQENSTGVFRSIGHNSTAVVTGMDVDFPSNQIVIDSSSFDAMDELQKQLAYDKLMNDVWIGVVLTLILISMVFCICSCFLYHQFRTWKRNYHSTVVQTSSTSPANDFEALKLHGDPEDPVPEYTLVSGLPSYEAALELLQKTPQSCLLVYPSVFNVFSVNEKEAAKKNATATIPAAPVATVMPQLSSTMEVTTPLLSASMSASSSGTATDDIRATTTRVTPPCLKKLPSYAEACHDTKVPANECNIPTSPNMNVPAVGTQAATTAPPSTTTATTTAAAATTITSTTAVAVTRVSDNVAEKSTASGFLNSLLSRK